LPSVKEALKIPSKAPGRTTKATATFTFGAAMPSVRELSDDLFHELERTFNPVRRTDRGLILESPDRRVAWGIARRGDSFRAVLMVERKDGWAYRQAERFRRNYPDDVEVEVVGAAQSGRPDTRRPVRHPRQEVLRPGLSISHYSGLPGTLGCIVTHRKRTGSVVPGLISASHVLGNMNRASRNDRVLHPANTDVVPREDYVVGKLCDYVLLSHFSDAADETHALGNQFDVAVAEIGEESRVGENLVPDPDDPDGKSLRLRDAVPRDEIPEVIDREVYKVGRTSGFTRGVLRYAQITRQGVCLPDGRTYIYKDIAVVHSTDPRRPFSQPGDSGSVVYTADGRGVGLVIGGTTRYTLLSPLAPCLEEMSSELYM
jgi:hypothetical protein